MKVYAIHRIFRCTRFMISCANINQNDSPVRVFWAMSRRVTPFYPRWLSVNFYVRVLPLLSSQSHTQPKPLFLLHWTAKISPHASWLTKSTKSRTKYTPQTLTKSPHPQLILRSATSGTSRDFWKNGDDDEKNRFLFLYLRVEPKVTFVD